MSKPRKLRRGNEYIPGLFAWLKPRPKPAGIFGAGRDFPLTTTELKQWLDDRECRTARLLFAKSKLEDYQGGGWE